MKSTSFLISKTTLILLMSHYLFKFKAVPLKTYMHFISKTFKKKQLHYFIEKGIFLKEQLLIKRMDFVIWAGAVLPY